MNHLQNQIKFGRLFQQPVKEFDTATQELQLDAMNRDVATAEARKFDMLAVANGKLRDIGPTATERSW